MMDWERLRDMIRPDLEKYLGQPQLTEKDYCDLKLILSDLEKTYRIQLMEEDSYGESAAGYYENYPMRRSFGSGGYGSYGRSMPNATHYSNRPSFGRNYQNGQSGHNEEEAFRAELQGMLQTTSNPNTRRVIQEAMDKLN